MRAGLFKRLFRSLLLVTTVATSAGCSGLVNWDGDGQGRASSSGSNSRSTANLPQRQPLPASRQYKVRKGDTLYSIAFRYRLDFRQLAKWNGIGRDYLIKPGQTLRLTAPNGRPLPSTAGSSSGQTNRPSTPNRPPAVSSSTAGSPAPRPSPSASGGNRKPPAAVPTQAPSKWRWPHRGKVVANYSKRGSGKAGLDISGKVGDKIIAAAGGVVVYSGGGLPRYGQLIIIKHGDDFLSAYAYNRKLLVKEGDSVKSGQKIAEMGNAPKGGAMLHFEIRLGGQPVDPSKYLPATPG